MKNKYIVLIAISLGIIGTFSFFLDTYYEYEQFKVKSLHNIPELSIFIFANDELECARTLDQHMWMIGISEYFTFSNKTNMDDSDLYIWKRKALQLNNELIDILTECGNFKTWCPYPHSIQNMCDKGQVDTFNEIHNNQKIFLILN